MDLKNNQTNSPSELVAKNEKPESWLVLALVSSVFWSVGFLVMAGHIPSVTTLLFNSTQVDQMYFIGLLVYLVLLPAPLSLWYRGFDRKVKLLVNENGIGFSTNLLAECNNNPYKWLFAMAKSTFTSDGIGYKEEFYKWKSISSYQFIIKQKGFGYLLYDLQLKPTLQNENLVIGISRLTEPFNKIQDRVTHFAAQAEVRDLGISQKSEFVERDSVEGELVSTIDNSDLLIRKRKPNLIIRGLIYFWSFTFGFPIVYNMLSYNDGKFDWVAFAFAFIFYGVFVYLYKRNYKLIRLTISKEGIGGKDIMYYWKDISSYQFTVAVKTVTTGSGRGQRTMEVVVDTLILTDKQGALHTIDVTDSNLNTTIEAIRAKVKAVTKDKQIEDLGFVKE